MSNVPPEWYELRNALEQGDPDSASTLLEKHPGLLDERNGIGETVLHFLAVENNQPAVAWPRRQGADLNVKNKFGMPVLFEVAHLGYCDLFLWFIEHGADPHQRKDDGQSLEENLVEFGTLKMLAFIKEHGILKG